MRTIKKALPDILFFVILLTIFSIVTLSRELDNLDEVWNYNFGKAIFVTEDVQALGEACAELSERGCIVTRNTEKGSSVTPERSVSIQTENAPS